MIGWVFRWARARSLVVFPFVGALPSRRFAGWVSPEGVAERIPLPQGRSPRQADVLLVVGDVPHKLAPVVQRAYLRMAKPSYVLHVTSSAPPPPGYALVPRLEEILPVDVRVEGDPPSAEALERGLAALRRRVRRRA
jgi:NADH-quinone oxidoreductase subunit B